MIPENIIISRTDSIGDVVLTLPVAKVLKDNFPSSRILFLGKEYTKPVIDACRHIDEFIEMNDFLNGTDTIPGAIIHVLPVPLIAKKAKQRKIPLRIGTTNRIYHWTTCNKLVKLSRKNSDLHEAQLNLKLLDPLGITKEFSLEEVAQSFGMENIQKLDERFVGMIDPGKYNLILHPKSQGNGREWGLNNFISLVRLLDKDRFKIFISGTMKERPLLQPVFDAVQEHVTDITGLMKLDQFISFIAACDGLVASGTGPLHIAAALGKHAYGIFPPMRPIHPGRWAPLGSGAKVFVVNKPCSDCRKDALACHCIAEIEPGWIKMELEKNASMLSF
jgi:ADP-heptose:LPS heptosyltransferase